MKLNFKIKKFALGGIGKFLLKFWDKYHTVVFFVYFLLTVVYGGFYWYKSVYASDWSLEKKESFMKEKDKTVILNEKDLDAALLRLEERRDVYNTQGNEVRNIFKLNE